MSNNDIHTPRVFISYSWTSEEYKQYVLNLVSALRKNGVDTIIDDYDMSPGDDKYVFMERIVSDESIDKVLILCDEGYKRKADSRTGGVGDETMIITPELYGKSNQSKFIPVVLVKDENGNACLPVYLKSRLYVDMTTPFGMTELLKTIYGVKGYKPPLGKPPAFVTDPKEPKAYKCAVCGELIEDDGLLVKLQKPYGNILRVVPIHKGRCDDALQNWGERKGVNTNSSMESKR
ncbi:toll/interleukin-1 receptor domain-containing protein [Selenomonas sp. KH1T6]|uniref:toll/interleukin-1 receptor domain-containing protein n=1 Tax=Selenomonas sp. KH1T6 TaxID=3158784 RepID=UPI0008A7A4BF|nr:SEFIR domain-containing protein [Selenomonas ruminantium]